MVDSFSAKKLSFRSLYFLFFFATTAIFVLFLCLVFQPTWETNDDVAMSMVAHGYGLATIGTPHLIFSNIIWGYIVRAIPEINGVLGYSIATLGVLIIIGTVILISLNRLGVGLDNIHGTSHFGISASSTFSTVHH